MRILFITNTPPIPSWGGAMTFFRHFCERKDFSISVITDNKEIQKYQLPYRYLLIQRGKVWNRICRTRFYQIPISYALLYPTGLPEGVLDFAREFKPDAIFTVAGSWSWMAIMAKTVASKLKVPLIGSFNDWWFYNSLYHRLASSLIEKKFRQFYKECDLALCTSEGMQKALGEHKNSAVLYPTGAFMDEGDNESEKADPGKYTVAFGGNLGDWYGKMLEAVIVAARGAGIDFKIFGSNASWSEEFDVYVKKEGMFKGQISFTELQAEMKNVDALLLLMGFDESCAMIEKTSFKTKFLDYLTFKKPILLWGPSYCSAVGIAREFDSAEICISQYAEDFLKSILKVKSSPDLQKKLIANAYRMYQERFHPDRIHNVLRERIKGLISKG